MKTLIYLILFVFLLALACAAVSCTKDKSTSSSSDYSCICEIRWSGGDSTVSIRYGNITGPDATSQCDDELKTLQSKYGYGTSSTGSQWVTCSVQ